jgi:hypothetical protein
VVSACFSRLASNKQYHIQWQTNDQWASLLWAYHQDAITPVIGKNELTGKMLHAALCKDKFN